MRVVTESLAWVVGANCRRIRTRLGITQEDLSLYTRGLGLRWTASKVGDFEAGRYAPTFATVLVVLLALNLATEDSRRDKGDDVASGITLADLIAGNGQVALTDILDVPGDHLAEVCRGRNFELINRPVIRGVHEGETYSLGLRRPGPRRPDEMKAAAKSIAKFVTDNKPLIDGVTEGVADVRRRSGLAEYRLAKQLGMSDQVLATNSFLLWQSTFSEERDRRAGAGANQQKKGRISRELRAELEEALADGNNQ